MGANEQKMLNGELYNGLDSELVQKRDKVKDLLHLYNECHAGDTEQRQQILRQIVGKIGLNCHIEQPFRCDYGQNIEIGDNVFINYNCTLLDCNRIKIGNNVLIGPDTSLYTAGHPIDVATRIQKGLEYAYPITIGDNVWIGGHATLLAGVSIGEGSIIGGGSVVTQDIPAHVVAVGNPCKIIRKIEQ